MVFAHASLFLFPLYCRFIIYYYSICCVIILCSPKKAGQKKSRRSSGTHERRQTAQPSPNVVPGTVGKQRIHESVQTELPDPRTTSRKRLAWSSDGGRSTSTSDTSVNSKQ